MTVHQIRPYLAFLLCVDYRVTTVPRDYRAITIIAVPRNCLVNLDPLTWLLPSGKLLVQAAFSTILLDRKNNVETPLDDMPHAVRVYPASAGTFMMPLAPANNWTATIVFCGGSNIANEEYDYIFRYLKMTNLNSPDGHLPTL